MIDNDDLDFDIDSLEDSENGTLGAWDDPSTWFGGEGELMKGDDLEVGKRALRFFYDKSVLENPDDMDVSFEVFIEYLTKEKGNFPLGFGIGINSLDISEEKVKEAMHDLAGASDGGVPVDPQVFLMALRDEVMEFDVDWIRGYGKEVKAEVVGVIDKFKKNKIMLIGGVALVGVGVVYFFGLKHGVGIGGLKAKVGKGFDKVKAKVTGVFS